MAGLALHSREAPPTGDPAPACAGGRLTRLIAGCSAPLPRRSIRARTSAAARCRRFLRRWRTRARRPSSSTTSCRRVRGAAVHALCTLCTMWSCCACCGHAARCGRAVGRAVIAHVARPAAGADSQAGAAACCRSSFAAGQLRNLERALGDEVRPWAAAAAVCLCGRASPSAPLSSSMHLNTCRCCRCCFDAAGPHRRPHRPHPRHLQPAGGHARGQAAGARRRRGECLLGSARWRRWGPSQQPNRRNLPLRSCRRWSWLRASTSCLG